MENIITQIQSANPNIPISEIQLPDGHSLNDMWVNYGTDAITQLINDYQKPQSKGGNLEIISEYKIGFSGKAAKYLVIGQLPSDLGNMRVSLQIIDQHTQRKHRAKIDLFDFLSVQNQCRELSDKHGIQYNLLEADLLVLTDLLEQYREQLFESEMNPITDRYSEKELTPKASEKAIEFLTNKDLIQNIDKLLEQSGIIGEEANRMLLFITASSYKMPYPLHGMVQGTSGGGKSHLINAVGQCMPQEDLLDMTRITPKSLYYYRKKELTNKLVIVQDFDGLDEDAQYAFREMQSNKRLSTSTAGKDMLGNTRSKLVEIETHIASLVATTKSEVYLDNMSRSVLLGIDESEEQTLRIIKRQNQKKAGITSEENEHEARQLLRNCMRVLKSHKVVNPLADKIMLPLDARMLRRLNDQFQDFVAQITILHQYQRKTDSYGRLIATKEDVRMAVEVFFGAIMLKVDELDGSTRQFFDRLKGYVKAQTTGTTYKFTQREIRQAMKLPKTTGFKLITILQELEYIQAVEGSANKGFKYVVSFWDNQEKMKAKIREDLKKQLETL